MYTWVFLISFSSSEVSQINVNGIQCKSFNDLGQDTLKNTTGSKTDD